MNINARLVSIALILVATLGAVSWFKGSGAGFVFGPSPLCYPLGTLALLGLGVWGLVPPFFSPDSADESGGASNVTNEDADGNVHRDRRLGWFRRGERRLISPSFRRYRQSPWYDRQMHFPVISSAAWHGLLFLFATLKGSLRCLNTLSNPAPPSLA